MSIPFYWMILLHLRKWLYGLFPHFVNMLNYIDSFFFNIETFLQFFENACLTMRCYLFKFMSNLICWYFLWNRLSVLINEIGTIFSITVFLFLKNYTSFIKFDSFLFWNTLFKIMTICISACKTPCLVADVCDGTNNIPLAHLSCSWVWQFSRSFSKIFPISKNKEIFLFYA